MTIEPKPVKELNTAGVRGLFFDVDDTFSTGGKITAEAYQAAWRLKKAGMILVPLTGRPAGWCDHMTRMWPVDAVVGENGAFFFAMRNGRMEKHYAADLTERKEVRRKLALIREEVLARIPGAGIASDQAYREFDLAIDYCEDVPSLTTEDVSRIVKIFETHGATTKVSSIHVNGWFGDHDKLTATRLFAHRELGMDDEVLKSAFVFVGDSPNDEPLFQFFRKSVGVANVADFATQLRCLPAYITRNRSGAGFAELAAALID